MQNDDVLCRAAHFPKFVKPDGTFDDELLLQFDQVEETPDYAMSLCSAFLCRKECEIHNYGCRTAIEKNNRFQRNKNRAPIPLTEEVHYLGFYKLTYGSIVNIAMIHYNVRCFWKPEGEEKAHIQVEFTRNNVPGNKTDLRRDRRAAIGILAQFLRGPTRHICAKDEHLRSTLESISLPDLH